MFSGALAVVAAFGAFLLSSCATTDYRISRYPQLYQSLSPDEQALVQQGRIREGMSQDAVFLAWGSPEQRMVGRSRGRPVETWIYTTSYPGYSPYYGAGFGYGYGYGGFYGGGYFRHRGPWRYHHFGFYDPFYDPFYHDRFDFVRVPSRVVSFQGGRVIGYQFLNSGTAARAVGY